MRIIVTKDKDGGEAVLTTQSSQSHYGCPVLEITADDVNGTFGPGDIVHERDGKVLLGYHIIAGWLATGGRTAKERAAGEAFLSQSPFDLGGLTSLVEWGMYRAAGTFPGGQPRSEARAG